MSYANFAYIYDKLMYDVDYSKWAYYIENIMKRHNVEASLMLDLGCGTGSFCLEMARRGYDMIGVDISADMLSCARAKAELEGLNILYLHQDMTSFELYGTVDVVLCLMDSINYITKKNDVKKVFKLVHNYLNPGGLFIFDINSIYKFENILGNNVFYDIGDEIAYIWQNRYDKRKRLCEFDLTFFVRNGDCYRRFEEVHAERAYTLNEMKEMVKGSGLKLEATYNELDFSPPRTNSERVFFVAKKHE